MYDRNKNNLSLDRIKDFRQNSTKFRITLQNEANFARFYFRIQLTTHEGSYSTANSRFLDNSIGLDVISTLVKYYVPLGAY